LPSFARTFWLDIVRPLRRISTVEKRLSSAISTLVTSRDVRLRFATDRVGKSLRVAVAVSQADGVTFLNRYSNGALSPITHKTATQPAATQRASK
jgi:hypothetical protein